MKVYIEEEEGWSMHGRGRSTVKTERTRRYVGVQYGHVSPFGAIVLLLRISTQLFFYFYFFKKLSAIY